MAEKLAVESKVREVVKAEGKNMSGDFTDKLSEEITRLVKAAIARATANGRQTVMAKDI